MMGCAGTIAVTAFDTNGGQQVGIGYINNLSKRSALYATYSRVVNGSAATLQVPRGPTDLAGGKDSSGDEFGMRHSF